MQAANTNVKAERISEIAWIRAVCTIGIVCFHFVCYTQSPLKKWMFFANGYIGELLVTMFFMVSGMVLRHNYPTVRNLGKFWMKRWKSIFPSFYLCFAFFYMENVFQAGMVLYKPEVPVWRLLLTVIGMDGYLADVLPNYYICGEWFLGAILILYLVYPLLCLIRRNKLFCMLGLVLLCVAFAWQAYHPVFLVNDFRNLISCLLSFCVGMVCADHRDLLQNKIFWLISTVLTLFMLFVKLPLNYNVMTHLCGFTLFETMFGIGSYVTRAVPVQKLCAYIGTLSFPIYLVQHKIVHKVQGVANPVGIGKALIAMALTVLLSLACAQVLYAVTDRIMKGKIVRSIDEKIFGLKA